MPTLKQRVETFLVNSKNPVTHKLVTELMQEIKTCRSLLVEVETNLGEGSPKIVQTLESIREYLRDLR